MTPPQLLTNQVAVGRRARSSRRTSDLHELHREFLAEQRFTARLAPATLRGYGQSFALLMTLMPSLTLQRLSSASMTDFFRRLETRRRSTNDGRAVVGVKASTVATYRCKLNSFFRWLTARGYLPANPLAGMPFPRVEYEDKKFLGRVEVERIFSCLVLHPAWRTRFIRKRNIALFSVLLYSGLRRGELLALRVTDIDLDRLELTVRPETSKSRRRRVVPINSRLCLALEDYLEERVKRGVRNEYLFTSALGDRPLTAEGLKHLVMTVKRKSGVTFHVHQFRHTFAVNVLNNGGDIAKLKQLLGHRDIRMTSTYLRALPTSAMRTDVEGVALDALL